MVTGTRRLVTGAVTTESIAWAVAERAQLHTGEVTLTTFDRVSDMTAAAASALPARPEILTLDASRASDFDGLHRQLRVRTLHGAPHAVAFAPR